MSKTSGYLYLDSDDRNNKPNPDTSDVTFNVSFRANNVIKLGLSSYDLVYCVNNINSKNNVAYIVDSITTHVVTLTLGKSYDYAELSSELLTQLNAMGIGAWTVTLLNGIFNLVAPVPVTFITNPINPNGRDWADMIGMTKDTPLKTVHNGGVSDITYTNKLYIICDKVHEFKTILDETSTQRFDDCLGVIYVNENENYLSAKSINSPNAIYPHHCTRDINNIKFIQHSRLSDLGSLRVYFLDDRGERLPAEETNKLRWSLELLIQD